MLACSDDSNGSGSDSTQKTGARIKVFETSDIHGYIIDATGGKEDAFLYRLAYLAKIFDKARASGEYDDVLLLDGGDIYAVAPFNNPWLLYDLTGEELAQQIVNGWKSSDMGDQVTGLTFEYRDIGTDDNPDIEVVSITLDDGTEVDIHGKKPIYRVIVSNYNATIENSVFIDKMPVYTEADSPIDNQAIIELLRDRRDRGEEHIPVDRTPRGSEVTKNIKEAA